MVNCSVELPSLPLPPLHRLSVNLNSLGGKIAELDQPESPAIPSLSTNDVMNALPSCRLLATLSTRLRNSPNSTTIAQSSSLSTSLPPAPRPLRSAQRPIPGLVPPPVVVIDDIPAGRSSEPHARLQYNHCSYGRLSSTSTAHPMRRRSSSIIDISSRHQSISPPGFAIDAFCELDDSAGLRKYALAEAGNAGKWDDLMERNARAGGTLHPAACARVLASDRLKWG